MIKEHVIEKGFSLFSFEHGLHIYLYDLLDEGAQNFLESLEDFRGENAALEPYLVIINKEYASASPDSEDYELLVKLNDLSMQLLETIRVTTNLVANVIDNYYYVLDNESKQVYVVQILYKKK